MSEKYKNNIKQYFTDLPNSAWGGITTSLLNAVVSCTFFFLSVYFVTILHLSIAVSGYILAFYSIGTMVGGLIGGKLADRFSAHFSSTGGLILESFGYFLLIFIKDPWLLGINAFILGVSSYIFITGNYTMVLQCCHNDTKQKFKALGLLSMVSNLGFSFSAILIGYLSHYRFAYIFLAASVILLLLAVLNLMKPSLSKNSVSKIESQTKKHVVQNKKIVLFTTLFCVFVGGAIVVQYSSTLPIYIRETFATWGLKGVSYLFALNCILVVILQTPIVYLIRNQNKLLMVGLGVFIEGVSLLMLNFYNHYFYSMLTIFVATIGEVIFFPSVQFICHEIMPDNKKGFGMGLYRTVYGASRAFGSGMGSFIYAAAGASFLWSMAGVFGLVCLILCWSYKKCVLNLGKTHL